MANQAAEAALPERVATLPRSVAIIEAFRSGADPADELLRLAAHLAHQHQEQWAAEPVSRDPSATAEQIAASKRTIDTLNARRAALIELLDASRVWAAGLREQDGSRCLRRRFRFSPGCRGRGRLRR